MNMYDLSFMVASLKTGPFDDYPNVGEVFQKRVGAKI